MAPPRGKNVQLSEGIKKLTGTFSAPPPLFVGEAFSSNAKPDPRHRSKQFAAGRWTSGPLSETFAKAQFLSEKAKFQEQRRYIDIYGPERKKKGFGSTDFPRRDEYSNTFRTAQHREGLKKETRMNKKELERNESMQVASVPYPEVDTTQPRRFLYDIAHPFDEHKTCKKCHRDDMRGRCKHLAVEEESELPQNRGIHHPDPCVAVDWPRSDATRSKLRRARPMTAPAMRSDSKEALQRPGTALPARPMTAKRTPGSYYQKYCEHCLGQGYVMVKLPGRSIIAPCADCKLREDEENIANSRGFVPMVQNAWQ